MFRVQQDVARHRRTSADWPELQAALNVGLVRTEWILQQDDESIVIIDDSHCSYVLAYIYFTLFRPSMFIV